MASVLSVVSTNDRRGAEVFAVQLADWLRDEGREVAVVALGATAGGPDALEVPVLGAGPRSLRGFVSLLRHASGADVLIANGGTTLLPTCFAALLTRKPLVYRNIGDPSTWGRVRHAQWRIGAPLRRAAVVTALYPEAAAFLRDRYRIDPTRMATIPNAVPIEAFPEANDDDRLKARTELGLDPDVPWIAFVGAMSEEKQPLLAFGVLELMPEFGLVMAGDGPLAEQCRTVAASFPTERVRLLGRVNNSRRVFVACDVAVVPSRTEGVAGVAIEAGLCGRPVVASNVGGMSEVVEDGVTGVLSDHPTPDALAAGIRWALAHHESLGAAARVRCAEQFSMDEVGAAWVQALDQATAGTKRSQWRLPIWLPGRTPRRATEPNHRE